MKKYISTFLMMLSLVAISGCKHGLTIEDLTRAQGICWWDVDISSVSDEFPNFGIAYRDETGEIISTSTMYLFHSNELGWPRPNKVRVIAWDYREPVIEFAVLWKNGGGVFSSVTNRFDLFNSRVNLSSSGNTVDLGEPLLSGCLESEDKHQKKIHLILEKNLFK